MAQQKKAHLDDINDNDDLESIVQKGALHDDGEGDPADDGVRISSEDEDDPETYVNTDEKRNELEFERQKGPLTAEDFTYQDKIPVASDLFKQYVDVLINNGKKNVPKTHICCNCWQFVTKTIR